MKWLENPLKLYIRLFFSKVTKPAFDFPPSFMGSTENEAVFQEHTSEKENPLVFFDINVGGRMFVI